MNRLRTFLAGSDDYYDDGGDEYPIDRRNNNSRRSGNNDYRRSRAPPKRNNHRYNTATADDLYLSDDDEWGMSATSPADRYSGRSGSGSSPFWDQKSIDGDIVEGNSPLDVERRRSSKSRMGRDQSGLQEWEREAMMRDSLDDAFEIGNDDHYHSDHRRHSPGKDDAYYDEVQEEIRSFEENESVSSPGATASLSSASSSKKEEVVNAYRDYLKSIRDGGFESYLDSNQDEATNFAGTPTNGNGNSFGRHAVDDDDNALERVLDIEEERAIGGSLYGGLYGVHDMRTPQQSPYTAWRDKAKALLRQEEERDSPKSRKILARFRRKRSKDNHNVNGTPQHQRDLARIAQDFPEYDSGSGNDGQGKMYSYRLGLLFSPRVRFACMFITFVSLLGAGLSYYVRGANTVNEDLGFPDLTIPPKSNNNGSGASSSTSNGNDNSQPGSSNPDHSGPSDAITNALQTFDPTWYDRRSGWEGITYIDAVNFCSSKESRVPCTYEMYCMESANGTPYRGERPNGEQWSPISNGANQWVQVGGMFTCKRYTELHDGKKPDWGITGISLEHEHGAGGITQNVMCCVDVHHIGSLDPFTQWGKQEYIDHVEGDNTDETTTSAAVNVENEENEKNPEGVGNVATTSETSMEAQKREKAVIAAFQPIWFSNSHGWSGTSYEDAILFCESYNHMVLCPYAAYCPLGRGKPALPGSMVTDLDGEEWVPANGPMNTWVQIGILGDDEGTRCTLHHDLMGERPQWGMDGTRKDVKHHILCCLM